MEEQVNKPLTGGQKAGIGCLGVIVAMVLLSVFLAGRQDAERSKRYRLAAAVNGPPSQAQSEAVKEIIEEAGHVCAWVEETVAGAPGSGAVYVFCGDDGQYLISQKRGLIVVDKTPKDSEVDLEVLPR